MMYLLSKLIPVRMHSTFVESHGSGRVQHTTVWWQWRGRILVVRDDTVHCA